MKNMRRQLLAITILCILTITSFTALLTIQTNAALSDAKVLSYRWYIAPFGGNAAYDGDLVVVGELENNGTSNIAYASVTGYAYISSYSNETAVANATCQIYGNNLKPDQKAPFYLDFANPEYYLTGDNTYTANVTSVVVVPSYVSNSNDEPYQGLTVSSENSTVSGVYRVVGSVTNTGTKAASQVRVVTTFYNSSGTVVSLNTTDILSASLKPGSSVNFVAVPVDGYQGEITSYATIVHVEAVVSTPTNTPTTSTTPTPTTSTSATSPPTSTTTEGTQDYTMIIIGVVVVVAFVLVAVVLLMRRNRGQTAPAPT